MPEALAPAALFALAGKTVMVTGASSGLGLQGLHCLARAGARVIGAARRVALIDAPAQLLRGEGRDVRALAMDVSDPASVRSAFAELDAQELVVDTVIHYAGVAASGKWRDNDEARWMRVLQTNLLGAERVSQAVASRLTGLKRGGNIIHVASTLGLTVQPGVSAYAASKAALIHLTKSMAMELWPRGIRVNCLAPGLYRTPLTTHFERDHGPAYFDLSLTRRMGEPAELDGALLFLASDASAYVNGVVLPVDGGNHLRGM
jgi:NAD(P)-dependent dehydrogenase (short-subunit alcohol dehydrogenase family)